jgi:hypothetical protein
VCLISHGGVLQRLFLLLSYCCFVITMMRLMPILLTPMVVVIFDVIFCKVNVRSDAVMFVLYLPVIEVTLVRRAEVADTSL